MSKELDSILAAGRTGLSGGFVGLITKVECHPVQPNWCVVHIHGQAFCYLTTVVDASQRPAVGDEIRVNVDFNPQGK